MMTSDADCDAPQQPTPGGGRFRRPLVWGPVVLVLLGAAWRKYYLLGAPYRRAVAAIEQAGGQVVLMDSQDGARVRLGGERVTDADLVHLAAIGNLENLFLGGSKITDTGVTQHVSGLASLRSLRLNTTAIGDAGLEGVKELSGLEELYLSETAVSDEGLKLIAGMTNLTLLDLTETAVSDTGLAELKGLSRLKILRLAGTQITDRTLQLLKQFPGLEVIILNDTKITDAGLESLKTLPAINLIRMHDTQVTDAGEAALRVALPKCRIDR